MSLSTRSRRRALLGASLSILLTACATVGPDFKAPDAPTAGGYAMAGDAAPEAARLDPATAVSGPGGARSARPSSTR